MLLEQLRDKGYTHAAVDFDGTLIDTARQFSLGVAASAAIIDINRKIIDDCIQGLRHEFRVDPVIVEVAVLIAARIACLSDDHPRVVSALERARDIYRRPEYQPPPYPGAVEVVDHLNTLGFETVLATHAGRDWTDLKKNVAGLTGKFVFTYCFDTRQRKSDQWPAFFSAFSSPIHNWVVIGDNLPADIAVPAQLGAYTIHVINGRPTPFSAETSTTPTKPSLSISHIADLLTV